ncbi:MalY/PatB family protein [Aliamphritea ceti]|uniref:MalY/PatB family protein n=1 Tax=Aliamphritea ceti TaxID=1524258 RepID=UPI0021C48304|nr:PatB family C-S lyase [Aliamphritea ceti]
MNKNQFDQPVDRRETSSMKWERYKDRDILPMWVADTDFTTAPVITQALQERVAHGVFGYTKRPAELNTVVKQRLQHLYQWQVEEDWMVWLPGLVSGLHLSCRTVTSPVTLTATPIYPPFRSAPVLSGGQNLSIPMTQQEGRWLIDFTALESAINSDTRLLLFCNPQNPGGTVYRRAELEQLADTCERHDLLVCSDEIHCDMILDPGVEHIPLASLNPEIAARCITLMAPSKTFNIAGLGCSVAIIADQALRSRFRKVRQGVVPDVNLLGYTAALAAYRDGDEWHQQQLSYLRANRDFLLQEINLIPGLKLAHFEATYLAWIDISDARLEHPVAFFEAAGVGMSAGRDFGDANFMRLNFGCPRSTLEEAVIRMRKALAN